MLKIAVLGLWLVLGNPSSSGVMTYESAYAKAEKENKPLVVLVGADWCAACQTMKSTTIQKMKESGSLSDVIFTQIDKDLRPELAEQIMQGDSLPQIIVFAKSEEGWKKFSLSGIQSEGRVKELIRRASSRDADLRIVR